MKGLTLLLGIDGVLTILSKTYTTRNDKLEDHLLCRLNYLVRVLSSNYDVKIVLFSDWKVDNILRQLTKYPNLANKLYDTVISNINSNVLSFPGSIRRILEANNLPSNDIILIDSNVKTKSLEGLLLYEVDRTNGLTDYDVFSILREI